jgi:small subunit ribosomal protein S16
LEEEKMSFQFSVFSKDKLRLLETENSKLKTVYLEERDLLAIRLMRMGAKKRPSYRIVVKEKLSKRDGAYLESIGTYNPIGKEGEIRLDAARAQYWIERGAQPTETVRRLIKANAKAQAAQPETV